MVLPFCVFKRIDFVEKSDFTIMVYTIDQLNNSDGKCVSTVYSLAAAYVAYAKDKCAIRCQLLLSKI